MTNHSHVHITTPPDPRRKSPKSRISNSKSDYALPTLVLRLLHKTGTPVPPIVFTAFDIRTDISTDRLLSDYTTRLYRESMKDLLHSFSRRSILPRPSSTPRNLPRSTCPPKSPFQAHALSIHPSYKPPPPPHRPSVYKANP